MKKKLLLPLLLFCSVQLLAQDVHFSQFFETPLLRNPALAGLFSGDVRVQSVYRNQWQSVTVPYRTVSLSAEFKKAVSHSNNFFTFGGQVLYDQAGTIALTTTHLLPTLNFHKSLSDEKNMYLSAGLMGGLVQRKFDRSKVTTNSQFNGLAYDPLLSDGESYTSSSYSYLDLTAGLSFSMQLNEKEENNLYFGFSYQHFNKSKTISFYGQPAYEMVPKLVVSGGIRTNVSDFSYVTFQGDFSKQGTYTEMLGGFLYSLKLDDADDPMLLIHAGAMLRLKDAVIPVVKLEKKPMAISVSYDANISQLSVASQSRGGIEITLSYQTFKRNDSRSTSRDAVRCPRF